MGGRYGYSSDRGRRDDYYRSDSHYHADSNTRSHHSRERNGYRSQGYSSDNYAPQASYGPPRDYDRHSSDHRPDNGYAFRGVANTDRHDFTFRSRGPPAPSFPRPRSPPRGEPLSKRMALEPPKGPKRDRFGKARHLERRSRFPPTHERALLKVATQRETTPEQLEGMNAQPRFREIAELDTNVSAPSPNTAQPTTQWSNPDPYSVLPPVLETAPKKDIVKAIRDAKIAAATDAKMNAVAQNNDFISFDMDDDDDDDDDSSDASGGIAINLPPTLASRVTLPTKPSWTAVDSRAGTVYIPNQHGDSQGKKRKYDSDSSSSSICSSWQTEPGQNPTPWFAKDDSRRQITQPGQRLHEEICDFYEYVRPRPFEETVRLDLIDRVQNALDDFAGFKCAVEVHSFGSFASGLYLPCADMDLVVLSHDFLQGGLPRIGQHPRQIRDLAQHLKRNGLAMRNEVICITNARVPLIKYTDRATGIKVDISFENPSGLWAIGTFKKWQEAFPAMPTIVSLVKQLLAMREQNEVHTGGLGGFSAICLVVSMLQLMPEVQAEAIPTTQHYGHLLQSLLELYGENFDFATTGITMDPPGYFDKSKTSVAAKPNPLRLTIIDPNNEENDISGGSRNIDAIFDLFRTTKNSIQARLDSIYRNPNDTYSVLACVLGGNYLQFDQQRERMRTIHEALMQRGSRPHLHPPPDLSKLPRVVVTKLKIKRATGTRGRRGNKSYASRQTDDRY